MIKITKSEEPKCLTALKLSPSTTYDDLKGECREEVRGLLSNDQKYICAYCQRTLRVAMTIEHYIAQTTDPTRDLEFHNFLGVCTGRFYLDKKSGKAIRFCSTSRASNLLIIDPTDEADINTLSYDENFKINSTNLAIQNDLDRYLNLNFDQICLERKSFFDDEVKVVQDMALEMGFSNFEAYSRAIKSVESRNPVFSGMLLYKFQELVDFYR